MKTIKNLLILVIMASLLTMACTTTDVLLSKLFASFAIISGAFMSSFLTQKDFGK